MVVVYIYKIPATSLPKAPRPGTTGILPTVPDPSLTTTKNYLQMDFLRKNIMLKHNTSMRNSIFFICSIKSVFYCISI
jgi:hypothetical protein